LQLLFSTNYNHSLNSSSSPVLTATHHSYGSLAWLFDLAHSGS